MTCDGTVAGTEDHAGLVSFAGAGGRSGDGDGDVGTAGLFDPETAPLTSETTRPASGTGTGGAVFVTVDVTESRVAATVFAASLTARSAVDDTVCVGGGAVGALVAGVAWVAVDPAAAAVVSATAVGTGLAWVVGTGLAWMVGTGLAWVAGMVAADAVEQRSASRAASARSVSARGRRSSCPSGTRLC
jgi:hypothetical protein